MNKIFLVIALVVASFSAKSQQDPQYSAYMFNHVVINPAYVGSKEVLGTTFLLRKQWVGVNGAPQTNNFSINAPLRNRKIGVGMHFLNEKIGPKSWGSAYFDFAYIIKMPKGSLSFGLGGGAISYQFNLNQVTYSDPSEIASSSLEELSKVRTNFDSNFGIYYHSQAMYIGYGVMHLNEPGLDSKTVDVTTANSAIRFNVRRHHFLTISRGFQLSKNVVFNPSIMVKSLEVAGTQNVDVNCNFLIMKRVWIGTSFRSSKYIVGLVQFKITDKFKFGYSFETDLKKTWRMTPSHEIMLGYDFNIFKSAILSPRYL